MKSRWCISFYATGQQLVGCGLVWSVDRVTGEVIGQDTVAAGNGCGVTTSARPGGAEFVWEADLGWWGVESVVVCWSV